MLLNAVFWAIRRLELIETGRYSSLKSRTKLSAAFLNTIIKESGRGRF